MSRIGKLPVVIPARVTVTVSPDNLVTVKGPKGELSQQVNKRIHVVIDGGVLHCTCEKTEKEKKLPQEVNAMHGLYRKLIANMVEGVTNGYVAKLRVEGVGYKVAKQGNKVVMNVGYSHPVEIDPPAGITLNCPTATTIHISGIDKCLVGQMAADIKAVRKLDVYHGYGIMGEDEKIIKKEAKKTGKK